MSLPQYFASKLLNGVDGATVKEELRRTFVDEARMEKKEQRTLASLHSMMTEVRNEVMARGIRSPSYDPSPLTSLAANEPDVAAFLAAPVSLQVEIQRHHLSKPSWSSAAECELAKLQILPMSMNTFKLSQAECVSLKQQQERALMKKNENCVVVADATKLLKTVTTMLDYAHTKQSFATLVFPLAIVSGRRQAELLNGRSIFSPSPLGAMYAVFQGQLKKHGNSQSYTIPLLVEYNTFANGWTVLRAKQRELSTSGSFSKVQVTALSNDQVHKRYNKTLRRALLKSKPVIPGLPTGINEHTLRSMYAAYVYQCFQCHASFARTAMGVLGHEALQDSLAYSNVKLNGAEALCGSFGPMLA